MSDDGTGAPRPADGSKRLYVMWGAGLAVLALLGGFCWFFVRPYLEVRAAVGRMAARKSQAGDEVKTLGGPEEAAAKCALYVRLPEKLATELDKHRAFSVLRACGQPAVPRAASLLRSRDEFVRMYAAGVLGGSKDPGAAEPLIAALKDSNAEFRRSVVAGLGNLKGPRVVDALIAALKDPNDRVRFQAVRALEEINDRRGVEPLIAALKDPYGAVREWAAFALGKSKDRRAVEPLKGLLADPYDSIREEAERSIREIESTSSGQ